MKFISQLTIQRNVQSMSSYINKTLHIETGEDGSAVLIGQVDMKIIRRREVLIEVYPNDMGTSGQR